MDFLYFNDVSFHPDASIGSLCEDLNKIVGYGMWYDTFQVQNTKWLWLVNKIVTELNSDKVLCGCFGVYPSYVSGTLNSVEEIHFYVLCSSKRIHYDKCIEKCIAGYNCSVSYAKLSNCYFHLLSDGNKIGLSFTTRRISNLPSELIFAQSVLQNMRLSSLVYGIVCINKRVTYITNQVLSSKHDCVYDFFDINLRLPKRLANCTAFTQSCSKNPLHGIFSYGTLYCTKSTHRKFKRAQCCCKLCIKDTPPSL